MLPVPKLRSRLAGPAAGRRHRRAAARGSNAAGRLLGGAKVFRAAVQHVLPSLVTIETFGGVSAGGGRGMGGVSKPGEGPTTGLVLSPDGYIVTSTYNFIRKPPIITVRLRDGSQKVATLLGRDETRKICVLKIEGASGLAVPQFAPRDELRVGQWAVSVGVGYGDDSPALSAGIISATSRVFTKAVQTDANTSPANYGGPLVDIEGRVIGVCVPLSPESGGEAAGVEWYDSGIGFAIPLHGAEGLLEKLKRGETVRAAHLGLAPKPATAEGSGVLVATVAEGSPAAKAGVQVEDKVLSFGGAEPLDPQHLRTLVGRFVAGDEAEMVVERAGQRETLKVTLEAAPETPPASPEKVVE